MPYNTRNTRNTLNTHNTRNTLNIRNTDNTRNTRLLAPSLTRIHFQTQRRRPLHPRLRHLTPSAFSPRRRHPWTQFSKNNYVIIF
jgi:hypothetical protein